MANITMTVPNGDVPRIIAAYEALFGEKHGGEGDTAYMKRVLGESVNRLLIDGEARAASQNARDTFVPVVVT